MSWFSSFKEQSIKLAQLYKNGISEFVANLNEDIKSLEKSEKSTDTSFEQTFDHLHIETLEETRSPITPTKDYDSLLNILDPYLVEKPSHEDLQAKISIILASLDEYINQDPLSVLTFSPQGFTNFEDFAQCSDFSDEVYGKIVKSDPQLGELFGEIGLNDAENTAYAKKTILRFIYSLICLLEVSPAPNMVASPEEKVQEEIVASKEGIVDPAGDALERKSQSSEQYVMVEDGSSSSNRSNETEKIEGNGQRDSNNLSESDEWQIEEKALSIELNNEGERKSVE